MKKIRVFIAVAAIALMSAGPFVTNSFAQYTKLLDFANASNGGNPYGELISDGGFLYGMTLYGGASNSGVIFKLNTDGSGDSKLLDFSGTPNGKQPNGALFSDGTFLYGMTQKGGANDLGVIFKIKPDGTEFSKLYDFDGVPNGGKPYGSLFSDGSCLYGMTADGGANTYFGTVFKYGITTGMARNNDLTGIRVFPIPCKGNVTVDPGESHVKIDKIEIINAFGEVVYTLSVKQESPAQLDLSGLQNGIYVVKICPGEKVQTQKIAVR